MRLSQYPAQFAAFAPRSLALAALVWLLAWVLGGGSAAFAAAGPWAENEHSQVRLIAATDAVGDTGEVLLGLQFELEPGWKTYWRSPGDAGYPPRLDWSGSENLKDISLDWPVPHRFSLFGLETFGYQNEVIFPAIARLETAGESLVLEAQISYLLCEEICIPYDEILTLRLPTGPATPANEAFPIDRFRAQVPDSGAGSGLSLAQVELLDAGQGPLIEATVHSTLPMISPDLLVEGPAGWGYGKPEVTLSDDGLEARLALPVFRGKSAEGGLEGQSVTLTVIDGRRGLETSTTLEPAGRPFQGAGVSFFAILGLALLGGLILNLMPCVLPVLSIKLLSAVGHGGRESGLVRLSFLASAAGILFSFMVLAAVAIGLKSAGMAVGWGIQFQQPVFLAFMALIVTLFACNLLGLFEIGLPGWMSGVATANGGHGLGGHFLTGAFATLLATPCSAPFLGTAVGFALSSGPLEIVAVFLALGLGLALPYLCVAVVPSLATQLPRPGPWMVTLRRILGLALAGTAVWLLTVLTVQVGLQRTLLLTACLVGLSIAIAILGRKEGTRARNLVAAAIGALVIILAALPVERGQTVAADALEDWLPLDKGEIARRVGSGEVVFVDVTADWCITCQVNKSLVIDQAPVAEALEGDDVVAMRGDWTLPNDEISEYLADFGRYGIPFNAVYGPAAPQGIPLPELLSSEAVLNALEQASGRESLAQRR